MPEETLRSDPFYGVPAFPDSAPVFLSYPCFLLIADLEFSREMPGKIIYQADTLS